MGRLISSSFLCYCLSIFPLFFLSFFIISPLCPLTALSSYYSNPLSAPHIFFINVIIIIIVINIIPRQICYRFFFSHFSLPIFPFSSRTFPPFFFFVFDQFVRCATHQIPGKQNGKLRKEGEGGRGGGFVCWPFSIFFFLVIDVCSLSFALSLFISTGYQVRYEIIGQNL